MKITSVDSLDIEELEVHVGYDADKGELYDLVTLEDATVLDDETGERVLPYKGCFYYAGDVIWKMIGRDTNFPIREGFHVTSMGLEGRPRYAVDNLCITKIQKVIHKKIESGSRGGKGYWFDTITGKWRGQISHKGKRINCGQADTEDEIKEKVSIIRGKLESGSFDQERKRILPKYIYESSTPGKFKLLLPMANKKIKYIGTFDTLAEAVLERDKLLS